MAIRYYNRMILSSYTVVIEELKLSDSSRGCHHLQVYITYSNNEYIFVDYNITII